MKLLSPKFPSATAALEWIFANGYGQLPWTEAYAKVVNEISHKNYKSCMTILTFPDGTGLPANQSALENFKVKV